MLDTYTKFKTASDAKANPYPHRSLPSSTRIGTVRLAVSNLESSIRFYSSIIGLHVLFVERESNTKGPSLARLGVRNGTVLLELEELHGVKPIGQRTRLGLYHTAILLPSRSDLGSFIRHLTLLNIPFDSLDHLVSEALYLVDPDGLIVEVCTDRPRSQWKYHNSCIVGAVDPLNIATLARIAGPTWEGVPAETTIGHVHFYVGDLERGRSFYSSAMGMNIMTSIPGALFVSAGGYHHHVGFNTWAGACPPASPEDARILFWELVLPDTDSVAEVGEQLRRVASSFDEREATEPSYVDEDGIRVVLRSGPAS